MDGRRSRRSCAEAAPRSQHPDQTRPSIELTMCIAGGSSVSIFDRYRTAAAASPTGKIDVFGKPVTQAKSPLIDSTKQVVKGSDPKTDAAANTKATLGSAAPTAVMGDRIEGTPSEIAARTSGVRGYDDFLGLMGKLLGIQGPISPIVNDPSRTIQAGRIGHAYGAEDLRIRTAPMQPQPLQIGDAAPPWEIKRV